MKVKSLLAQVLRDNRGATAVEYGLIVALIVIAMVGALEAVATGTTSMWKMTDNKIKNAGS